MPIKVSAQKIQASSELVTAGAIWGFGFIVTVWALPTIGPIWISVMRFAFSALLIGFLACAFPSLIRGFARADLRKAALPGCVLASMMILQTWGLRYTSATNSGFITTLYVVMIPVLQAVFLKKRVGMLTLFLILMALMGTAMVARVQGGAWNVGDLLTLGCALAAAVHILLIDRFATDVTSPLALNTFQSCWGAIFCLPFALCLEQTPSLSTAPAAWAGVAYLTVISTTIAFLIQIRAQRFLAPTTASLLFLLESPFSALFARVFLKERLLPGQWFGGGLILLAAVLCILRPEPKSRAVA